MAAGVLPERAFLATGRLMMSPRRSQLLGSPAPIPPCSRPSRRVNSRTVQPRRPDLSLEAWGRIVRVSSLIEQIAPGDDRELSIFQIVRAVTGSRYSLANFRSWLVDVLRG
jgi:hypothetical protein